jgi:hypothetical protein
MSWDTRFPKPFHAWVLKNCTARKLGRKHRRSRPSIEGLEDRTLLSLVADGGTTALTVYLMNNETFGIQAESTDYQFTLGSSGTFSNGGVANAGEFSGFGTNTLTLSKTNAYTTIDIIDDDVSVGATSTSVTMLNSGTNTYSTSVYIQVVKNPEPGDVQIQTSTFTGSSQLYVSTTGGISLPEGNPLSTVSGQITLQAGIDGTLTSGIALEDEVPITSTSGPITLTGTSGVDSSVAGVGVRLINNGFVSSGSGAVVINGSTGVNNSGSDGVAIFNTVGGVQTGVSSDTGPISITGSGGTGNGVVLSNGVSITSTGTGTGAATITINGTSTEEFGVYFDGPSSTLTSVDGNISITGTTGSGAQGGTAGVNIFGGVTLSSTGTDATAATIAINGTDNGAGPGVQIYNNTGDSAHDVAISSAASGMNASGITITATSGQSDGFYMQGSGVSLTTDDGAISITASTASTNGSFAGAYIFAGSTIRTTGTDANAGSITITGTDTGTGVGVEMYNNTGGSTNGVSISTAGVGIVPGTNFGGITIKGTSSGTQGVYIQGPSVSFTTVDGVIGITGDTSSTNSSAPGVEVIQSATISTTGIGTITIDGTDTGTDVGVYITGSTVSAGGNVTITTTNKISGGDNIDILSGAMVQSTGGNLSIMSGNDVDLDATSTLASSPNVAGTTLVIQGDVGGTPAAPGTTITLLGTLQSGSGVMVQGEGPSDNTIVFTPASSPSATLIGQGGDDAFTVAPATVTGTVAVNAALGTTTSQLTIQGTSGADSFVVNSSTTTMNGHVVSYSVSVGTITVDGLGGTNTFTVIPSTNAVMNINGDPSNPLVDALTLLTPSGQSSTVTTTTPGSGFITTTGGYQNVNFTNIATMPTATKVFDNGTSTLTISLGSNVTLGTQSNGLTYTFTLTTGAFTNAGVVTPGLFTGFGTTTLTLQAGTASSPSYKTISIIDTASNDAVNFINSGANTYASSFNVTLTHTPQAEAVRIHQSTFTGSAGLTVSTTGGIQVLSGSLSTSSGPITLAGNTAGSFSGDLIGVDVQAPITSATGTITLTGISGSGSTAGADIGVALSSSGPVTSGSGNVIVTGMAGTASVDAGVELTGAPGVNAGITSSNGNIQITGKGSTNSNGVVIESGSTVTSTGTGTITIIGNSLGMNGVLFLGPNTTVTSRDTGAISITGTTSAANGGYRGVAVSQSTISSTGLAPAAAPITINGTDTGAGAGIYLTGASTVSAVDGAITVTSEGDANDAVFMDTGSVIQTTHTGSIAVTGKSTAASGITLVGPNTAVTTALGSILIKGQTASSSAGDYGTELFSGTVSSTGSGAGAGPVTVFGLDTNAGVGVLLTSASSTTNTLISTVAAPLVVQGNGGLYLTNGTVIQSTGAGSVLLSGNSSFGNVQNGITMYGSQVTSVTGSIQLSGTSGANASSGVEILNGSSITSTGTGASATSITINGTAGGSGQGVVVGSTVAAAAVVSSVDGPISISGTGVTSDAVQVNAGGILQATGAGNIQVTATPTNLTINGGTVTTASGFLTLTASQNIELIDGAAVASSKNSATIQAGDNVAIDGTSSLGAPAANFSFSITGGNAGNGGTVTILGTLLGGSPGQILGGNGNDTFIITPVASPGFSVSGGAGNDFITIDPQSVTGPVNVNEAAGAGTDTLTIQGSASADAFSVGGLATIVDGHVVTYTPYIASILVQGLASNDTFLVSPSTSAPITVEGGTTGTPTNALTVFQPQGQTTTLTNQTATSGTYVTTGGYQNVAYTGIQTLAPPNNALPAVTGITFYYGNGLSFTVQNALPRDLPWQVTAIAFTFNEPVNATLNSLSFTGIGIPVILAFGGNGSPTLVWNFASPVTASNVVATLASSGINAVTSVAGGKPLNGNTATTGANPFEIALEILYGDVDGDAVVDSRDAVLVLSYIQTQTGPIAAIFLDVNGDGVVNMSDYTAVRSQLGHSI